MPIYVDDIIFGSTNQKSCEEFSRVMTQKFEMSMMGELNYFLGFQVKQLKDDTFISQTKYMQDLLKRFGMKDAKPAKTPMGIDGHVDLNKRGSITRISCGKDIKISDRRSTILSNSPPL